MGVRFALESMDLEKANMFSTWGSMGTQWCVYAGGCRSEGLEARRREDEQGIAVECLLKTRWLGNDSGRFYVCHLGSL